MPDIIINQLRIANILQKEGQNKKELNNKDLLKCFYICSVNNVIKIFHQPQDKPKTGVKTQHTEQIANQLLILSQRLQNQQWDTNQERYLCQF
jgi:hypothetical protein